MQCSILQHTRSEAIAQSSELEPIAQRTEPQHRKKCMSVQRTGAVVPRQNTAKRSTAYASIVPWSTLTAVRNKEH